MKALENLIAVLGVGEIDLMELSLKELARMAIREALRRLVDRFREGREPPAEVVHDTLGDRSETKPTRPVQRGRQRRAKPKADVDA